MDSLPSDLFCPLRLMYAWPEPYVNTLYDCICVGLARTIYIQCMYGIFGREITKCTVIYGVCIQFWPTLYIWCYKCRVYTVYTYECTVLVNHTHRNLETALCMLLLFTWFSFHIQGLQPSNASMYAGTHAPVATSNSYRVAVW